MSKAGRHGDLKAVSTLGSDYVTIRLAGQLLGIPVLAVHDVLSPQTITHIPRAPAWIAGVLNLRGRIVTAIDLRQRLGFARAEKRAMSVVVDIEGEPYSLQIDAVGEVVNLGGETLEKNPVTLDARWREVSRGVYRLDKELLVILDVDKLLDSERAAA